MKRILTKEQAVSLIRQIKEGATDFDLFRPVVEKDKLLNCSSEKLEETLIELGMDNLSAVVDEVKDDTLKTKMKR